MLKESQTARASRDWQPTNIRPADNYSVCTITSRLGHQRRKKTILRDANAQELVTKLIKPAGGIAIPRPRRKPRRDQWTCRLADKNESEIFHCDRGNRKIHTHSWMPPPSATWKPIQLTTTPSNPTQKHAPQPTDIPTSSLLRPRHQSRHKIEMPNFAITSACPCQWLTIRLLRQNGRKENPRDNRFERRKIKKNK
jgi:hypothetical protein